MANNQIARLCVNLKRTAGFIIVLSLFLTDSAKGQAESSKNISEQLYIQLGGEKQYVEIMSTSNKNPVLLFLHGGPGWPQTPQLRYFNSELTKSITIVAWEQPGCGKSFMKNPDPKNLSLEKLISDGHELTQWLKKKFKTRKIYLAGFSWGSVIGLNLVNRFPDDYSAYFGISQVINLKRSIDLSREWIKKEAELKNDTAMLRKIVMLEKKDTSFCKNDLDCFLKKYEMLTEYHGAIHNTKVEAEIDRSEKKYPDYKEYDWMKGFIYSADRLGNALFQTDLSNIKELKVPVYFFVGRYDWNLPTIVTEDYFKALLAPKKEMVWFENSGHEPLEEEAHAFDNELIKRIRHK